MNGILKIGNQFLEYTEDGSDLYKEVYTEVLPRNIIIGLNAAGRKATLVCGGVRNSTVNKP